MDADDIYECLSCGWQGKADKLRTLKIKFQTAPMDLEEKVCPECLSIFVEQVAPASGTG